MNWSILKIKHNDESHYRLLKGYSGGYLHGDSWELNSGIASVDIKDGEYIITGFSGSVYTVHPNNERMNTIMLSMFHYWIDQGFDITIIPMDQYLQLRYK